MRFSSIFQRPPPPLEGRPEEAVREIHSPPPALPCEDLPEDLDARVRLVGEWQLGEA